ncbi:MAG: aminotransferase class IV [Gammaproteobacteria bacterium]
MNQNPPSVADDPSERPVFLNGRILPLSKASISPQDRGFLFSDSVYEVILIRQGGLCNLNRHLKRLEQSLQLMQIPNPYDLQEWRRHLTALAQTNEYPHACLYLQVSRGIQLFRDLVPPAVPPANSEPTVFAILNKQGQNVTKISAATAEDMRWGLCQIKTTGLTANVMARMAHPDAQEVIMHRQGNVTEGASSSVFAVTSSGIVTPPLSQNILPSVTRALLLGILAEQGHPCSEQTLSLDELRTAQEIWVTNALGGFRAVTSLDGATVGNGECGPIWQKLSPIFDNARNSD